MKGACEALGISRSSYYISLKALERRDPEEADRDRVQEVRDEGLLERIRSLKASHPFWGYRRITAWLKHREGLRVNRKRVRRVMREHGLGVLQRVHRAKRAS